jgi:hypothetical protein
VENNLKDVIKDEKTRKEIADGLKSNNQSDIVKALHHLEKALGDNLGKAGAVDITNDPGSVDKFLKEIQEHRHGNAGTAQNAPQQNLNPNNVVTLTINGAPQNITLSGNSKIKNGEAIDLLDSDKATLKNTMGNASEADIKKALKQAFNLDDAKTNELYAKIKS